MMRSRGVYQSEAAECGLACLATCLNVLGSPVPLAELRYKFGTDARGASLSELTSFAAALNLTTRAVRCEPSDLPKIKLPAILHWGFNHFVVVVSTERAGKVKLFDPASGYRTATARELARNFTGVALEVSAAFGFTKRKERSPLSLFSLFSIKGSVSSALIRALIFSLLLQLYVLVSPFFVQLAVDEAAAKSDLSLLSVLAVGFAIFGILNALGEVLRGLTIQYVNAMLGWEMSTRLFHHMLRLPLQWFQRRKLADALTRFDSLEPIKALISGGLVAAVFDGVLGLGVAAMMFVYSATLAWVCIAATSVSIGIKLCYTRFAIDLGRRALQASVAEKGKRIETLRAIQSIKLMGGEARRETDWANHFGEAVSANQKSARLQVYLRSLQGAVDALGFVVVVYLGAKSVMSRSLSVGMLYAFISYRQQFLGRISTLVEQSIAWRMLDMHSDRLADIALEKREEGVDRSSVSSKQLAGAVELRDVSFRYSSTGSLIFSGVSLMVQPGEMVAIIGGSGGGKSSLLKVMLGLYPAASGRVLFDGIDAHSLGFKCIREQSAAVMQDDELLSGSIAENVSFFAESVDFDRVWHCLGLVCLAADVRAMPMQLHTLIGDMGSSLSGGQRQRLLLARALYRAPRILVLDEATSNLDVATEKLIHENLRGMSITRIFVTHRPEAARLADRAFLLERGRLKELAMPGRSAEAV